MLRNFGAIRADLRQQGTRIADGLQFAITTQ